MDWELVSEDNGEKTFKHVNGHMAVISQAAVDMSQTPSYVNFYPNFYHGDYVKNADGDYVDRDVLHACIDDEIDNSRFAIVFNIGMIDNFIEILNGLRHITKEAVWGGKEHETDIKRKEMLAGIKHRA